MGDFRAKVGGRDVLVSGTVIAYGNDTIEIYPVEGDEYKVEIVFEDEPSATDAANPPPGSRSTGISAKHLRWTLVGFSNPLGSGTTQAVEIGAHIGRRLYLSLTVHTIGVPEKIRLVNFEFLLGEATSA